MKIGRLALVSLLVVHVGQLPAGAAPPAASAAAAGAPSAPPVEFEKTSLPAREKELLARYAQQVVRWAMIQRVAQAVAAANARPMSDERVRGIDAAWQKGGDPEGLATALMQNDCAQALQAVIASNPGWGEAFATDAHGAIVCMSQRTSDFWQGDEPKFTRAWADGAGAIFVGAAEKDESSGVDLIHISVPVRVAGKVSGVLVVGKMVGSG
jgi:hypothetical protein